MDATIRKDLIKVESHSERPDVGRAYLTISVPNGWDDVKKLTKKVLEFNGRLYTFTGWNSDRNECYFCRPINGDAIAAKIK